MTSEYQACGQTETLLLINQATQIKKQIDIATTLMAVSYTHLVADAKELGIETATPNELMRMKQEWNL